MLASGTPALTAKLANEWRSVRTHTSRPSPCGSCATRGQRCGSLLAGEDVGAGARLREDDGQRSGGERADSLARLGVAEAEDRVLRIDLVPAEVERLASEESLQGE